MNTYHGAPSQDFQEFVGSVCLVALLHASHYARRRKEKNSQCAMDTNAPTNTLNNTSTTTTNPSGADACCRL